MKRLSILIALAGVLALEIGISVSTASATVLCKTATNPCTGGTYAKGTTIEASLKSGTKSVLHPPIGDIECSSSSIKGEVTGAGGEGANVTGTLSTFSFGSCNTEAITVLKKGTFRIESTGGGNGTLVLEGFETTTKFGGFHCIWGGSSSIPLTGGSMASAGTTSTVSRTGGSSGIFCDGGEGAPQQWTVDYTVTAPEPLYVAET